MNIGIVQRMQLARRQLQGRATDEPLMQRRKSYNRSKARHHHHHHHHHQWYAPCWSVAALISAHQAELDATQCRPQMALAIIKLIKSVAFAVFILSTI